MVGKDAAKYLGWRQEKGKDGKTHYYVTTEDATLCGQALSSKLGAAIGEMITRTDNVTELSFADSATTKNGTYSTIGEGGALTVGAEESLTGNTQIFLHAQSSAYAEQQFNTPFHRRGFSPGTGRVWAEDDVVLAHEFGHAYANAIEHKAIGDTNGRAVEFENLQRGTSRHADRTKFTRTYHF